MPVGEDKRQLCSERLIMMRAINISFFLYFISQIAFGAELSDKILYFCNANKSEFSINLAEQSSTIKKKNYTKHWVNWAALLKLGPQKNEGGDLLKSGSKVAMRQCGMIQIKLESGFINDNIQGESGAVDFPVIELRIAERTVIPRTALDICVQNDKRANIYFGSCPDHWAQSIKTIALPDRHIKAVINRKFENHENIEKETTEAVELY